MLRPQQSERALSALRCCGPAFAEPKPAALVVPPGWVVIDSMNDEVLGVKVTFMHGAQLPALERLRAGCGALGSDCTALSDAVDSLKKTADEAAKLPCDVTPPPSASE
eukprot:6447011-Amphidinium_carterae.1